MLNLTKNQEAMLSLLSYELFRLPLREELTAADWPAVLEEGNRQAVTALLYPGMKKLRSIPEEARSRGRRAALASAKSFEGILRRQGEIIRLLQSRGIPCAVLKGTSAACRYPDPMLRVPGDIDILVGSEKLQFACDALSGAGYVHTHTTALHACFQKDGVDVELHRAVSSFPEGEKGAFTREFMEGALGHSASARIGEAEFPVLSGVYQLIALLSHMERHLCDAGIGLRQVCDWAAAVNAMGSEITARELGILEQCGLLRFGKVMTKLCERYLGLPPLDWAAEAEDRAVDGLMEDILEGGNFHAAERPAPFSRGVLTDVYAGSGKRSLLRSYFGYIRRRAAIECPWAKGKIWVLLFGVFYPARFFLRVLLGRRKKISLPTVCRSAVQRETLLREMKLYQ